MTAGTGCRHFTTRWRRSLVEARHNVGTAKLGAHHEDCCSAHKVLKGRDGTTVTVDVTTSTTYKDPKVTSPSFANVTTGEMVSVEGTTSSDVVTATSVLIGSGDGMWGHGRGYGPAASGSAS